MQVESSLSGYQSTHYYPYLVLYKHSPCDILLFIKKIYVRFWQISIRIPNCTSLSTCIYLLSAFSPNAYIFYSTFIIGHVSEFLSTGRFHNVQTLIFWQPFRHQIKGPCPTCTVSSTEKSVFSDSPIFLRKKSPTTRIYASLRTFNAPPGT